MSGSSGYANMCGKRYDVELRRKVQGRKFKQSVPCRSWVYVTREGTCCGKCNMRISYCRCKDRKTFKDWEDVTL